MIRKISIVASSRLTGKEVRLFRGNVKDGPDLEMLPILGRRSRTIITTILSWGQHTRYSTGNNGIPSICNRIPPIYLSWNRYHFYLFILFPMQMLFRSCSVRKIPTSSLEIGGKLDANGLASSLSFWFFDRVENFRRIISYPSHFSLGFLLLYILSFHSRLFSKRGKYRQTDEFRLNLLVSAEKFRRCYTLDFPQPTPPRKIVEIFVSPCARDGSKRSPSRHPVLTCVCIVSR